MFDTRLSKRTKHRSSNTRTKELFYFFDRMFDDLQILSNTTKHDLTRSNSTKQGVQTVKCLLIQQCLMMFGRQTFIVCPGSKKHFVSATMCPRLPGPLRQRYLNPPNHRTFGFGLGKTQSGKSLDYPDVVVLKSFVFKSFFIRTKTQSQRFRVPPV